MGVKARIGCAVAGTFVSVAALLFASGGVASADTTPGNSGPLSVDLTTCPQLQVGSTGPCVTALQQDLLYMGDQNITAADGIYGPQTSAAVADFQYDYGMNSTGVADTLTVSNLAEDVQDMQAAQDGPSDGFDEVTSDLCDSIPWGGLSNECNSFWGSSPAW